MAEQCLSSSTDIPSSLNAVKESNSLDTLDVDSLIRRSLSNQVHVTTIELPPSSVATNSSSASSTASLTIYCIETGSVAQSIRRRQSLTNPVGQANNIEITSCINEGCLLDEQDKTQVLLTNADTTGLTSDDDNDSFDDDDDDDETTLHEIIDPKSYPISSNYVSSPCPICFEPAVLQVSPCCYFLCCNHCWRAHISATINDGRIKIPCVSNECHKYLTRESIVNFVRYDPSLHDRYLKLYLIANQNPRAKTCPRCCHLYSLDAINVLTTSTNKKLKKTDNKKIPKQVQCSECSLVWCFRCSAPWHENLTCKQFIKGDKLLSKWINQKNEEQWNARKCPKCASLIQRAGGCPHMTCQSCSCEFCYLCGRRYLSIPLIGQHSNKLSMFGCPYNFYPEKPWLRRTIRGVIATGVVVASPVIIAGAVTAAITVLPPFGIYKLVTKIRSRRRGQSHHDFPVGEPFLIEPNLDAPQTFIHGGLQFDIHGNFGPDEILRLIRERTEAAVRRQRFNENEDIELNEEENNTDFPLAIFAHMDIEHLFSDDVNDDELNNSPLDFRTCPTTPAPTLRKGRSRSLCELTTNGYSAIHRHHSITTEHQ